MRASSVFGDSAEASSFGGAALAAAPRQRVGFASLASGTQANRRGEGQFGETLGRYVERLFLFRRLRADGCFEGDLNLAFFDEAVVNGGENLGVVAVGEGGRQFEFAEQVLLDGQLRFCLAGQRVAAHPLGRQVPCGRLLGHRDCESRLSLLIRHDGRIPITGLKLPSLRQDQPRAFSNIAARPATICFCSSSESPLDSAKLQFL